MLIPYLRVRVKVRVFVRVTVRGIGSVHVLALCLSRACALARDSLVSKGGRATHCSRMP